VDGLSPVQFSAAQISAVGLSSIQSQQKRSHPAMDAAAKLLGMSASDLRSALQSGQSLADIASSKGISQDKP
jgi:tape measure domain-containing protein